MNCYKIECSDSYGMTHTACIIAENEDEAISELRDRYGVMLEVLCVSKF